MKNLIKLILSTVFAFIPFLGMAQTLSEFQIKLPVASVLFTPAVQVYNFGNVAINTNPIRTFQIINKSSDSLSFVSTTEIGAAVVQSTTCNAPLAPGAFCTYTVLLPVTSEGLVTGEVRVLTSASTTPEVLRVTAFGATVISPLTVSPGSLSFGEISVNGQSDIQSVSITNASSESLYLGDLYMAENGAYFAIANNTCPTILAGAQSCVVDIRFRPKLVGATSSKLVRELEDGTPFYIVSVSGSGVRPVATWSSSQANFINIPVGQASPPQMLTLTNTGRGVLNIDSLLTTGDTAFSINSSTCGLKLDPNQSCTVGVTAFPPDTFIRNGSLRLNSSSLEAKFSAVQLYMRPILLEGILIFEPGVVDFGTISVGEYVVSDLIVKSVGAIPVGVTGYTLSGANTANFSILNANDCIGSLDPGNQCILQVRAEPFASGYFQANVNATSSASTPTLPASLQLAGIQGQLIAVPNPWNFGELNIGSTDQKIITVTNVGIAPTSITTLELTGANASSFTSTGCAFTILNAGDSCDVTVSYTPVSAGVNSAQLVINNNGIVPDYSVNLSGTAQAVSATGTLSDFTCPLSNEFNTSIACTATLTNTGTVSLPVSSIVSTNNQFNISHTCGAAVAVSQNCTVTATVNSGAPAVSGTRTFTTTVNATTGAGLFSKNISLIAETSKLTVVTGAYANTPPNGSSPSSHTITNSGKFPVQFSSAPTLSGTGFSALTTTCTGTLNVGSSCTVTNACVPDSSASGTLTGIINISGSNGAVAQINLSCLVLAPSPGLLSAAPNPVDFGNVFVNSTLTATVTVTNNATTFQDTSLSISGADASRFSIVSNGCSRVNAKVGVNPGICQISVGFLPGTVGLKNANLLINGVQSGQQVVVALTGIGAAGVLSANPNPVDFGDLVVNSSLVSRTVIITNVGNRATQFPVNPSLNMSNGNFSMFANASTPSTCSGVNLQPNATCQMTAFGSAPVAGLNTATGTLTFSNSISLPLSVSFRSNGVPPPPALATLNALNCTSPVQVGGTSTCRVTITNAGGSALTTIRGAIAANAEPTNFNLTGCPASLAPGASCLFTVSVPISQVGSNLVKFASSSSAPTVFSSATVEGRNPSAVITLGAFPLAQTNQTVSAVHTVTNNGSGVLTFSNPKNSLSNTTNFAITATSCGTSLAVGASCTITTSCVSANAGTVTSSISALFTGGSAQETLSCVVALPKVDIAPVGPLSQEVGGWSSSGNYFRITNSGSSSVTLSGFFPHNSDWVLFMSSTNASHCRINQVLAAGASCQLLSMLNTGAPGNSFNAQHRVRTNVGDIYFNDSLNTHGVSVVASTPFSAGQINVPQTGVLTVSNLAPYALSSMSFSSSGSSFTVLSHTCSAGLAATGQPGSSCTVQVRLLATTAGNIISTINVSGGYPQVINTTALPVAKTGIQGSIVLTVPTVAPKLTLTTVVHAATLQGQTSTSTHTLRNEGVGPIVLTGSPSLSSGPFTVLSGSTTCVNGMTLNAGATCSIITNFAPVSATPISSNVTLTINSEAGATSGIVSGTKLVSGDISLTVSDGISTMFPNSNTKFNLTVTNPTQGIAQVSLLFGASASGGASIASQAPGLCGTIPSGSTCSINGSSATLTLKANSSLIVSQIIGVGSTAGSVKMDGSITVAGVTDTNSSNNSASDSTLIQLPVGDLSVTVTDSLTTMAANANTTFVSSIRNTSSAVVNATLALSVVAQNGASIANLAAPVCATIPAGSTCSVAGQSVTLRLNPNALITVSQVVTAGASSGNLLATSTVSSSSLADSNSANNTATDTTAISLPYADLSVTLGGLSGEVGTGINGSISVSLRNLSLSSDTLSYKQAVPANFGIGMSTASGSPNVSLGAVSCGTVTAGATCSAGSSSATVSIPPGGTVNLSMPYATGLSEGSVTIAATIEGTNPAIPDPVLTNNSKTMTATVKNLPTLKRCMFVSPVSSTNTGCAFGAGSGCYMASNSVSALTSHLVDGWITKNDNSSGIPYLAPPQYGTWKGTGATVTPVTLSFSGNSYAYIIYPIAQRLNGGSWQDTGLLSTYGSTLVFWSGVGSNPGAFYTDGYSASNRAKVLTSGGIHTWHDSSTPIIYYKSEGSDVSNVQYRQTWIENSPGPNCAAPNTTKVN